MTKERDIINFLKRHKIQIGLRDGKLAVRSEGKVSSDILERIKQDKEILINWLRNQDIQTIPISRSNGDLKASFAQRRLWFLNQYEGEGDTSYNITWSMRLKGVLHIKALSDALNSLVVRHASLRTRFEEKNGEPVQVIAPELVLEIPVIEVKVSELKRHVDAHACHVFDLTKGPLIKVSVLRLSSKEHVLLINTHHIISDGWSMGVFVRELSELYGAYVKGERDPLPELPIQYADYAHWQREWLQDDVLERQTSYWQDHLKGAPKLLELPTDRPRPAVQSYRGSSERLTLSPALLKQINALSLGQGVTLFMTLLAAFKVLLYRYSHQKDLVVGTPIANRNRTELEGLIGFFANTLVLRTQLDSSMSFEALLNRVKTTILEAYDHQDIPFEYLVERLNPERNISHSPVFQVMFSLQNAESGVLELTGLELEPVPTETVTSKFDLSMFCWESGTGLGVGIEYSTDLFEAATIQRMLGHYKVLLEGIVQDPSRLISRLPLLTEQEYKKIVYEWNATETAYPKDKCIHQLFEEQVKKTPDAVAVVYEDRRLRYRELNARANQLAHYLIERGVGPEVRVGICVERSLEMVIGLLGILKAGGCYVPLDPEYPPARLQYMIEDSQVTMILAKNEFQGKVSLGKGRTLLALDMEDNFGIYPAENSVSPVTSQNFAYVIYTSGSTGWPKGVMVTHRNICRLVCNTNYVAIDEGDIVAQASNASFDAVTFEVWGAFSRGATLFFVSRETLLNPTALCSAIKENGFSILFLTTALFNQVSLMEPEGLSTLKYLLFGGESIDRNSVGRILVKGKPQHLAHVYGPTENTTFSTHYEIIAPADIYPIGKAITASSCFVLDAQGELLPVGVAGELCVGGAGLARGYLNRPELTAEKFVPNPFSEVPGERLYRTGDLARYLPDGNIEFLGRIDHQVKIRGFRIELGEIEHALLSQPEIKEALVLAHTREGGDKYLVAYIVAQSLSDKAGQVVLDQERLRQALKGSLPEYMVPSYFVQMEALPLTPNGKVDRKALLPPDASQIQGRRYVAPQTEVERQLVSIWAEVLKLPEEKIGIEDNFFELGGHSLLAMRVVARVRDRLKREFPLKMLFQKPVIRQLGLAFDDAKPALIEQLPLRRIDRKQDPKLSFAQRRLWFLNQYEGEGDTSYNIPWALRLRGNLDVNALNRALNGVVARHESLRTVFGKHEGEAVQVIAVGLVLEIPVIEVEESRVDEHVQSHARHIFDLSRGPLIKVSLLKLSADEHVLLINMHHIVSDGWSSAVFTRELSALYGAYVKGEPDPLPALPVQYVDYAHWQREWLQGEVLKEQLGYWEEHLKGAPKLLELPTDRSRPAAQSYRGCSEWATLPKALLDGLNALAKSHVATLFMVLLAAFKVLLYRYTHQRDLVVGTPVANRSRPELEGLIGFFVNTLALRTQLEPDESFEALLDRVRVMALDGYAHQDVPFEFLVERLNPERSMSYSPVFQVMFALQNMPLGRMELPGLMLEPVRGETATSKFDLAMFCLELESGLRVDIEYNTDLFDAQTIKRMLEHYGVLLSGIAADASRPIALLPLLTGEEYKQIVYEWNATEAEYPKDKCIHHLFEEQVEKTPDAVAVVYEDKQLRYQELNVRANQLAHYLIEQGVGPEVRVGICVERSLEMVIGLLGILKAGGCYVPLDPEHPQARLDFMVEDAGIGTLLTQSGVRGRIKFGESMNVIALDGDAALFNDYPNINPITPVTSKNLVYVIYTSGSTGSPKGTLNYHGGLMNRLAWMQDEYGLGSKSKVLQKTPYTFDVSVWEFFWPLREGAELVLARPGGHKDPEYLAELIEQRQIDTLHFVPSMLEAFLSSNPRQLSSLRRVICSGEALPKALVDRFNDWSETIELHNLYGPTEASIDVSYWRCDPGYGGGRIPIGRPIDNTQLIISDRQFDPVPVGVSGELYIGGVGLARGYLNRPDLTAEKFVPNPFSKEIGGRLYRTGDLVRYLPDGNIEFLGRIDHQVKIRGFRIELGEIEHALLSQPEIKEAVVLAHNREGGDKYLVAYIVARSLSDKAEQVSLDQGRLRQTLKGSLPEYMVPSYFVQMEALPLTPNGKVDRKVLLPPDVTQIQTRSYVAPQSEVERQLVSIWAEVLKLPEEKIGIEDNFFALGGHSLLAVGLVNKCSCNFGVKVEVKDIFKLLNIYELGGHIEIMKKINSLYLDNEFIMEGEFVLEI